MNTTRPAPASPAGLGPATRISPVSAAALPASPVALYLALTCPAGSLDALQGARIPSDLAALAAIELTGAAGLRRATRSLAIGDMIAAALADAAS